IDEARAGFGNPGSNFDATLAATNDFTAETVTATGDIRLASTAGNLVITTTLAPGDDVVLSAANGSITLDADVTAGGTDTQGDFTATARSLSLGNGTLAASGLIGLTSTAGGIAGTAGLTITSNSGNAVDAGVARALSLSATGGSIALAGTTLNGGANGVASAVLVTPPAAASTVTLGTVNARALTFAGSTAATDVTLGTATLVDSFGLTLTAGSFAGRVTVTAGDIAIAANAGSVTSTRLAASQAVTVSGLTLDIDETNAGFGNPGSDFDATLTATNDFTAETVTATGDIRLASTAGNLVITTTLAPGDDVVLSAANGSITLNADVTAGGSQPQGDFTATAQSLALGNGTLAATGFIDLAATAGSLAGTAGLVITSNSAGVADPLGGRGITLAGGTIDLAAAMLNGGPARQSDVTINAAPGAATQIDLGIVRASGLFVTGLDGDLSLIDGLVTEDIDIASTGGAIRIGTLTGAGDIRLAAETLSGLAPGGAPEAPARLLAGVGGALLDAGGDLVLAAGDIQLDASRASGAIGLQATRSIDVRGLDAGTTATLTAAASNNIGGITGRDLILAGGDITLAAHDDIRLGAAGDSLRSTAGSISIDSSDGNVVGLGAFAAASGFAIAEIDAASLSLIAAGEAIVNDAATSGDIALGQAGDTGSWRIGSLTSTGGAIDIFGTAVTGLGAVSAANLANNGPRITAANGNVSIAAGSAGVASVARLDRIDAGGTITVSADAVTVGQATSTGGNIAINAGSGLSIGTATALAGEVFAQGQGGVAAPASPGADDPAFAGTLLTASGANGRIGIAVSDLAQIATATTGTAFAAGNAGISIAAGRARIDTATAFNGGIAVTTGAPGLSGALAITTATAGNFISLTKAAGNDSLTATTLTAGVAAGSPGGIALASDTDISIGTLTATRGSITATAGRNIELATVSVAGLAPDAAADAAVLDNLTLTATSGSITSGAITVEGTASLTASGVVPPGGAIASDIALTSVVARLGGIAISAPNGSVTIAGAGASPVLGLDAATNVSIAARDDIAIVTAPAGEDSVLARTGFIDIASTGGSITGLAAPAAISGVRVTTIDAGSASVDVGGEAVIGSIDTSGDIAINPGGGGSVRLGRATSSAGNITAEAQDLTGLATGDTAAVAAIVAPTFTATLGAVTLTAGDSIAAQRVTAGTDASLTADRVDVTTALAGGAFTITAGSALALASVDAASVAISAIGTAGVASSGLPVADFGATELAANGATSAISVTTSELAQLGAVSTGAGTPVASNRISITAGRTTIATLTAGNGGIDVTTLGGSTGAARDGALEVGPVTAAGSVRLAKLGGGDGLTGTSIVAGTGSDAPGNITLISNTSAVVSTLTATGGDIGITSTFGTFIDGDVTAREATIAGSLTGGNYSITAGGIALGNGDNVINHLADNRVTLTALGSAINVGTITGGAGLVLASNVAESGADPMLLRARDGISLPGITMGGASLASRSAAIAIGNDTPTLTLGRVSALRLQGLEAGEINPNPAGSTLRVLGAVTFLDAVTLTDSLDLVSTGRDTAPGIDAIAGGITTRTVDVAGANSSLALEATRGTITVLGAPTADPLAGLSAGGDIALQARGDIRILAASPDQDSVLSRNGSITAISDSGSIGGLDPLGVTQGFRAFALTGGSADVRTGSEAVIGSITVSGDIRINEANAGTGFIRLGTASSSGGDIVIAGREVTGLPDGDDAAVAAPVAPTFTARAGNVSLTASDTVEARRVTAGNDATVVADRIHIESASAGGVLQLVAGSGLALSDGSGGSAVILSGDGGAASDSAGLPIAGYGRADLFATGNISQTITVTASELVQLDEVAAGVAGDPGVTEARTIDIGGGRVSINSIIASNGSLNLFATGGSLPTAVDSAGALRVGSITAGSGVLISKLGGDLADAANIVRIDSLVAGTKSAGTNGIAITINSNSDVVVTDLVATRGNVNIAATRDIDLTSATTSGTDAFFSAIADTGSITIDSLTGTGDISLTAIGNAPGAGASYASDIEVGRLVASTGNIFAEARAGAIRVLGLPAGSVPAIDANRRVELRAEGDIIIVDGDATTPSVLARTGDIVATSNSGSIRGATRLAVGGASRLFDLGADGRASMSLDGETLIGTIAARDGISIGDSGAGSGGSSFVRLGQASSSDGSVDITARELTGLPGGDDAGVVGFTAPSFMATLGAVVLSAADTIQASSVTAGSLAALEAGNSIAVGNIAAGDSTLARTGTLWLGTVRTGGLDVTAAASAGSDSDGLPASGFGAADLAVTGTALPTIRVTTSELAQLGRITAGPAGGAVRTADVVAGGVASVTITAGRTTIADVQINNGGLAVTTTGTSRGDSVATAGALVIDNAVVATGVRLAKAGGTQPAGADATANDLRIGTLTAGTTAGTVGGIAITSDTDVTATSLTAMRGNVAITAARNIAIGSATVSGSAAGVGATFTATATTGSITADTITGTGDVTLTASGDAPGAGASYASNITVGSIAASLGSIALATPQGAITVLGFPAGTIPAIDANANVSMIAEGDITIVDGDAATASVLARTGSIVATSTSGSIRGATLLAVSGASRLFDASVGGNARIDLEGETLVGSLTAAGDIAFTDSGSGTGGNSYVRLGQATSSGGDIAITARELTGLPAGDDAAVATFAAPSFVAAQGAVALTADDTIQASSITAGTSVTLAAGGSIAVGNIGAGTLTSVETRTLWLGTVGTGTLDLTAIGASGSDSDTLPRAGFGGADLTASADTLATISVTTSELAQLGVVTAGPAATANVSAADVANGGAATVTITAGRATIADARVNNGGLAVTTTGTTRGDSFATAGALNIDNAVVATGVRLTKAGGTLPNGADATANDLRLGTLTAGTKAGAVGGIVITSNTDVTAASLTATRGNVAITAARKIGLGNATVSAGTLDVTANSGGITATGTVLVSGNIALATTGATFGGSLVASDIALTNVESTTGNLTITATRGNVRGVPALAAINGFAVDSVNAASITTTVRGEGVIGDLAATNNIALTGGTVRLRNATTTAGTITANTDVLTGLAGGSDVGSNNGATLIARGNITVRAGDVPGAAPGGTTPRDVEIASIGAGGSIDVNGDAIAIGSADANAVTLTAGRALRLDTATSRGAVSLIGGVASAAPTGGVPVAGFGGANLVASGSGGRVSATVVNAAQLGTVRAGTATAASATDTIAIAAANANITTLAANNGSARVTVSGAQLTVGTATAATNIAMTATTGSMNVGSATAATSVALTAPLGTLTIGTATAERVSLIARDVVISNTIGSNDLVVAASAGTTTAALGDFDAATGTAPAAQFRLSQAEINLLNGDRVTIDTTAAGGGITTTIGNLVLDADTGDSRFSLLSSGRITLAGAFGDAAPPVALAVATGGLARTVQIGGTSTAALSLADIAAGTGLANRIDGVILASGGPSITLPSGVLDLRARMVLFGSQLSFDRLAALGINGTITDALIDTIARDIVSNPGSELYTGRALASRSFLSANQLTLNYRDLALFQNTGNQASAAGIMLGTANPPLSVTALALTLNSGGTLVPNNAFAAFGRVNGFINRTVAVLPAAVVSFADGTGGTRVTRLVLANSRINGCVVGSPGRGCLIQDIPPPQLRILDERNLQLFDPNVDLTVPFNPLVGTNNETLIGDITTTGAVDCSVPGAPGCPVQEPRP
ncbi:hypothetical protein IP88_11595, partial [alpha proteobacterium AAP81b]